MNNITITEKQMNYLEDVVYNGLQPAGFSVGGGGGDTSGLYYSKVQLDGGQLDNRYFTETESDERFAYKSHNHDDLYYTKAQLNAGQLNNLYYTISEINDWRNSVTKTEMGYLHGVASGIQGQINARAIISGTPAANQVPTWISGTQIKGNSSLTFNGTDLVLPSAMTLSNANNIATKPDIAFTTSALITVQDNMYLGIDSNNDSTTNAFIFIKNAITSAGTEIMRIAESGQVTMTGLLDINQNKDDVYIADLYQQHAAGFGVHIDTENTGTDAILRLDAGAVVNILRVQGDGKLGVNNANMLHTLNINGTGRYTGDVLFDANIGTNNYVSETTGWQGNYAGEWDIRRLFTNKLVAKTFIADIDLALLSGHIVSKSVTQVSRDFTVPVNSNTGTLYVEALPGHPTAQVFANGDWIRLQIIDRTGGGLTWVEVWGTVTSFVDDGNGEQHYAFTTQDDGGASGSIVHGGAAAQDFGQSGDGFIQQEAGYETHTPWLQVATWVTDPSVPANINVRSRLGNLAGITGQSGYGLVTRKDDDNYVSQWWNSDADWGIRGYVGGNQVFRLGNTNQIAGWTIASDAFYTGTKHTGDYFSTTGITLASDGSIHTPNLYVNTDDEIGFRAEKLIKSLISLTDNIILSDDSEVLTNNTDPLKVKTITLGLNVKENRTLRIYFELRTVDGYYSNGRIYRNGNAVGAQQQTTSTSWQTYFENITNWNASDNIELYIWGNADASPQYAAHAQNFRVCGKQAVVEDEITEV